MYSTPARRRSAVGAEPAIPPVEDDPSALVIDPAFAAQQFQHVRTEQLQQGFRVPRARDVERTGGPEQPIGDDGVQVRVEAGVVPEGVDHGDHPEHTVRDVQHEGRVLQGVTGRKGESA
ncbi:MAG: hypothetical protein P1P84_12090 [Deferrisomatales bacterium]|nr:hypothetical protein [Deferrisomatales bacterium]